MSMTQGQQLVRDYASQFETLLGRLDSYDESMMLNQFIWGLEPELARSVSLHYPKSIVQVVSLAETTEPAVKASRRPATKKQAQVALDKKAQVHPIGAEDSGVAEQGVEEIKEAVEWGILVEEAEDQLGDEEGHLDQPDLTRWHVIGAGFVAIWPATVPKPEASREEAVKVALPKEHLPDPGKRPTKRTRPRSSGAIRGL